MKEKNTKFSMMISKRKIQITERCYTIRQQPLFGHEITHSMVWSRLDSSTSFMLSLASLARESTKVLFSERPNVKYRLWGGQNHISNGRPELAGQWT